MSYLCISKQGKRYGKDGGYGRTRMWDRPHETTPEEFYGDVPQRMLKKLIDNFKINKEWVLLLCRKEVSGKI